MRPQTYAIRHKVNSLLFEPSLSTCETWLLPHAWTLPILRYNRDDHGESKDQGQAWKRRRKKSELLQAPDIRPQPGHPARHRKSGGHHRTLPKLNLVSPDIRPEARTSGSSRVAGHPAPSLDIRTPPVQRATAGHPGQLGHPASQPRHPARHEAPDIRPQPGHPAPACAQRKGQGPMYPPLTYPFVDLDYIYSPISS